MAVDAAMAASPPAGGRALSPPLSPGGPLEPTTWQPDELQALGGAPFALAASRLAGGKASVWGKAKLGVGAVTKFASIRSAASSM